MDNRHNEFWATAPSLMRKTEEERHPRKAQFKRVLDWEYGPTGLILHGGTGTGKTRALYALADWQIAQGYTVKIIDGGDLRRAILNCITPTARGNLDTLLGELLAPHILGIDDFDKIKFSEGVFDEIFRMVNHRTANELPIIYTMNSTGSALEQKMSSNGASDTAPLIRRMREFCVTLDFDVKLPDPPPDDDISPAKPPTSSTRRK